MPGVGLAWQRIAPGIHSLSLLDVEMSARKLVELLSWCSNLTSLYLEGLQHTLMTGNNKDTPISVVYRK